MQEFQIDHAGPVPVRRFVLYAAKFPFATVPRRWRLGAKTFARIEDCHAQIDSQERVTPYWIIVDSFGSLSMFSSNMLRAVQANPNMTA